MVRSHLGSTRPRSDLVMAGLDPAVHAVGQGSRPTRVDGCPVLRLAGVNTNRVDGRVEPGHDS